MTEVLIVSVNYRVPELAIKCLASVSAELGNMPETKMVVVENGSGDGSFEKISTAITENGWQDWASCVDSGRNGGFAFGNNVGIRPALNSKNPPEYIWLLNPDAEVCEGAGNDLYAFMESHPEAGFVTGDEIDVKGELQPTAFYRFSALGEFVNTMRLEILALMFPKARLPKQPESEPFQGDWLSGCSLMIRRKVFADVGLMDESYFLYFEESDFCLQAQRKGWELWYTPGGRIYHEAGSSTGIWVQDEKSPRRPAYWFESRRRYFLKNFSPLYAVTADGLWMLGYSIWKVRRFIQRKPDYDPPYFLRDFFMNSVFIKGFAIKEIKNS